MRVGTVEVVDGGEERADDLGDHDLAVRGAVALHPGAEVLQLRLRAGGPLAVLRDQVALRLGEQLEVVVRELGVVGALGVDQFDVSSAPSGSSSTAGSSESTVSSAVSSDFDFFV